MSETERDELVLGWTLCAASVAGFVTFARVLFCCAWRPPMSTRTLSARFARTWGVWPSWAALDCMRRLLAQGWHLSDAIQYAGEID